MPSLSKVIGSVVASVVIAGPCMAATSLSLATVAEQSKYQRTGRYEEVERLCADFQQHWPEQVRCFEFGRSPEGRPMLALAVSADGVLDPPAAQAKQRPVVLMQGGIHAGEIDGKDAGFLALREMLENRAARGALARVTFVFVPVFSVDGHERFGRWNRPNQVGPEEMGWRTTAQNLNLNRDYVKADAQEMQAMLRLLNEWDPILYVDLHVTDGAKFEHDVAYGVQPVQAGDPDLRRVTTAMRDGLMTKMKAQGSLPLDFYPAFVRDDDPQSGFVDTIAPARFSHIYWSRHNRIGVLVETHSWKDYATRVRITHNSIVALTELAAANGEEWLKVAHAADARSAGVGGASVPLAFGTTDRVTTIDFRGYEYTREPSAISGALVTHYDDRKPQLWHLPIRDEVIPTVSVNAPRGGYIVPAAYADMVAAKLTLHAVTFRKLGSPISKAGVETFRATEATPSATTFEGRTAMTLKGEWQPESRDVPAGSLFVPIAQAHSLLAMTLLEPADPDSLVSWGFFNNAFERKEYMEAYVAEIVGEDMLRKDPAVRKEFERRLAEDHAFATDPEARLDFFYRQSPSWDERYNLYPIYRTDVVRSE